MPEFDDLRNDLRRVRVERDESEAAARHAGERLRRRQRDSVRLRRQVDENDALWQEALAGERTLAVEVDQANAAFEGHREAFADLIGRFEQFTDPRSNIRRLPDGTPILLFPLRLEVRFKTIAAGGGVPPRHQLLVRVFPDDCSVESFDETLTEAEVERARDYWIAVWRAGAAGDPALEARVERDVRGAWRDLVGSYNAGRARWIEQNYRPVDEGAIPTRASEDEVILVIPVARQLDPAVVAALPTYWTEVWATGGDPPAVAAAAADFGAAASLPPDEVTELLAELVPHNLEQEVRRHDPSTPVQVGVLEFEAIDDIDTKLASWSRPSTVRTLPERLVLLGFRDGNPEPVVQELGALIPDQLVAGPSPADDIDAILTAEFGPGFASLSDDEKAERYVEFLSTRSETKWLFDFDEAVASGMGFRVDISDDVHDHGLDRLMVLGVTMGQDSDDGKQSLESLLRSHHLGDTGVAIVAQGTPTNNTDDGASGYSFVEDADDAFDRYYTPRPAEPTDPELRWDGRWLADLLGIDASAATLDAVEGFDGTDQSEARAMTTALFDATVGFYMESMIQPVLRDDQRELVRWTMLEHVRGRGVLPALRIADQPYGILPTSTTSRLRWLADPDLNSNDELAGLQSVHNVIQRARSTWDGLTEHAAHLRPDATDAHQALLDALGLHATSVEFKSRIVQSFLHHYNYFLFYRLLLSPYVETIEEYRALGMSLLRSLGYDGGRKGEEIPALEKFFLTLSTDISRPLVDDQEFSETAPIAPSTPSGDNYIGWLIHNAEHNHKAITSHQGFVDGRRPKALLYEMLRHSVDLGFADAGLTLYEDAAVISSADVAQLRVDPAFVGYAPNQLVGPGRYELIYREEQAIAVGTQVVDHISALLRAPTPNPMTKELAETVAALRILEHVPTARLERVMVEHVDCCSYRLDAWLLGLVNVQLWGMRFAELANDGSPIVGPNAPAPIAAPRAGVHLGAYGWLEDVRSDDRTLTAAPVPTHLEPIFDPAGDREITVDDTNAGHVHAPSVNHALTAAVLRNAYLSNADEDDAEVFKVNISSERVRAALAIVQGIQHGQSLSELLGYQLERGLHDNTTENLDVFVYELRKVFPLSGNRMRSTKAADAPAGASAEELQRAQEETDDLTGDRSVSKVEARNVVDGLALLDHVTRTNDPVYPFGFTIGDGPNELRSATGSEIAAIEAEVHRLLDVRDAVADLAMAEGVHQVVQGNYDRAGGALDAYSKGGHPPLPEVIRSSGNGIGLTHRVGIHLPATAVAPATATPRGQVEPAVDAWLGSMLPANLGTVVCVVEYGVPDYLGAGAPAPTTVEVSIADLGLRPIDLLYMLGDSEDRALTALDDHVLRFVDTMPSPPRPPRPRPDAELRVDYAHRFPAGSGKISPFEVMALIGALRTIVESSRPLNSTDVTLPNEADTTQDDRRTPPTARVEAARQAVTTIVGQLDAQVAAPLSALVDPESFEASLANATAIVAQLDAVLTSFGDRQLELSLYGFADTGSGFVHDRLRSIHRGAYDEVASTVERWVEHRTRYDDLINIQLPAATDDAARFSIVARAERAVASAGTMPRPTMLADYVTAVAAKRTAFDAKLAALIAFVARSDRTLSGLVADIATLTANIGDFDTEEPSFDAVIRQIVVLAEDVANQATSTVANLQMKMGEAKVLLDQVATTTAVATQVKLVDNAVDIVFGESFTVVPTFTLTTEHAAELQQSIADRTQLLDHQTTRIGSVAPVDEWLHGVARVRDKVAAWEQVVILSELFGTGAPITMAPIQLPYRPNDHWLALAFPESYEIDEERMLYTAYLPAFTPTDPQCGLLVDEWTEVIPTDRTTTGLAFHYDRPNSEPAQAMLLVTPSAFTGSWSWGDVVQTLHDTLDLIRIRAVEPDQLDRTPFAQFLPATVSTITGPPPVSAEMPVTMAASYVWMGDLDGEG